MEFPRDAVKALLVDYWIVDVKDLNLAIYRAYTGRDNDRAVANLLFLKGEGARITARVPLIPGFNTLQDAEASVAQLRAWGIEDIDRLTYTLSR